MFVVKANQHWATLHQGDSNRMSKRAAKFLGIGFSAIGPAMVLFTGFMFRLDPAPFILMIIGAGLIGLGARLSTIAKTMNEP